MRGFIKDSKNKLSKQLGHKATILNTHLVARQVPIRTQHESSETLNANLNVALNPVGVDFRIHRVCSRGPGQVVPERRATQMVL